MSPLPLPRTSSLFSLLLTFSSLRLFPSYAFQKSNFAPKHIGFTKANVYTVRFVIFLLLRICLTGRGVVPETRSASAGETARFVFVPSLCLVNNLDEEALEDGRSL